MVRRRGDIGPERQRGRALRLVSAALGAAAARRLLQVAPTEPARTNFRGRTVSLAAGPALATSASVSAAAGALADRRPRLAAAFLVAGLGAGALGRFDDQASARAENAPASRPVPTAKGFRGHVGALRRGQVTSGLVKLVGIGATGLVAAALLPSRRRGLRRAAEIGLGAGVIAGTANLVNLLDLRPGRALKAGLLLGGPLAASRVGAAVAGPVGAAAAVLPDDLGERVMIGDCGANALGALLGVGLVARTGIAGRAALFAGIAALTAASERVSFTAVIEATPGLRDLDRLGRRP